MNMIQRYTIRDPWKLWILFQKIKDMNEKRASNRILKSYSVTLFNPKEGNALLERFAAVYPENWEILKRINKEGEISAINSQEEQDIASELVSHYEGDQRVIDMFDMRTDTRQAACITFRMSASKFEAIYGRMFKQFVNKADLEKLAKAFEDLHLFLKRLFELVAGESKMLYGREDCITYEIAAAHEKLVGRIKTANVGIESLTLIKSYECPFYDLSAFIGKDNLFKSQWKKEGAILGSFTNKLKSMLNRFNESTEVTEIESTLNSGLSENKNPNTEIKRYPLPISRDLRCSEICFEFVDGRRKRGSEFIEADRMIIKIPGNEDLKVNFEELGMHHKNASTSYNLVPDRLWCFLLALMNYGKITRQLAKDIDAAGFRLTGLKKKDGLKGLRRDLAGKFEKYFGINNIENPFFDDTRKLKGFQLRIKLQKPSSVIEYEPHVKSHYFSHDSEAAYMEAHDSELIKQLPRRRLIPKNY